MEFPVLVVEGTAVLLLQPSRDAVEVECVVASAPGSSALFACVRDLVGLAIDAGLHNMVLADGAVVYRDV